MSSSEVDDGQYISPVQPADGGQRPGLYTEASEDLEQLQKSAFALANLRQSRRRSSSVASFALFLLEKAEESYAQLLQDLFALYVTDSKTGGYFLEIGTGDGVTISNSYLLEHSYGWDGVVVEPNPVFHKSIREHRKCLVNTKCVIDKSGETVQFDCTFTPEFSGIHGQPQAEPTGSTEHARNVSTIEVETISLNDLLEEVGAPQRIDYMSIDVEGGEFTILNAFDFTRWQIDCLTVEHNFQPRRELIYDLLTRNGYSRVFSEISQWDDWYIRTALIEQRPDRDDLIKTGVLADKPAPLPETAMAFVTKNELEQVLAATAFVTKNELEQVLAATAFVTKNELEQVLAATAFVTKNELEQVLAAMEFVTKNEFEKVLKDNLFGILAATTDVLNGGHVPGDDAQIDEKWGEFLTEVRGRVVPVADKQRKDRGRALEMLERQALSREPLDNLLREVQQKLLPSTEVVTRLEQRLIELEQKVSQDQFLSQLVAEKDREISELNVKHMEEADVLQRRLETLKRSRWVKIGRSLGLLK